MTKDEALKIAIEALIHHTQQTRPLEYTNLAIQACKDALAETQEPVPIAILHRKRLEVYNPKLTVHEKADVTFLNVDETDRESNMRYQSLADGDYKLFTTPPSREWVGLSDEEVQEVFNLGHKNFKEFARLIEMHLKAKNG